MFGGISQIQDGRKGPIRLQKKKKIVLLIKTNKPKAGNKAIVNYAWQEWKCEERGVSRERAAERKRARKPVSGVLHSRPFPYRCGTHATRNDNNDDDGDGDGNDEDGAAVRLT